jgi:spermidine synthase
MFGTKILAERSSKYNKNIRVVRSLGLGTYIQVNGLTQSGGVVEQIWKNTLKKLQTEKTLKIKNILILGLGGGTVAKLLRKKYPDAKITGVEIDPIMIELGKKYLDLDKYNIDIKIEDARNYKFGKHDLVIVDTYLGNKVVEVAGSDTAIGKIVIFNRLYYGGNRPDAIKFGKKIEKVFSKVTWHYPVANLMFICEP